MKYCTKCKTEKEPTEFYVTRNRKDGLSGWCKCCMKAQKRDKYWADGRPNRTTDTVKPRCAVTKERRRQEKIVKYGLAVVEAMEAFDGCFQDIQDILDIPHSED